MLYISMFHNSEELKYYYYFIFQSLTTINSLTKFKIAKTLQLCEGIFLNDLYFSR